VAPLPDGGIVSTEFMNFGDPDAHDKLYAGADSGNIKEWQPGRGWEDVPGTGCGAANGVDVSTDGDWCYIASWSTKRLIKVSRGATPVRRFEVELDFLADNVKFQPDGSITVAGQDADPKEFMEKFFSEAIVNTPGRIVRVDPETLAVSERVCLEGLEVGTAATGLDVNGELWISSSRGDRIAYVIDREA
jgi:sugar lactone lactonase YvrE